MFKAFAEQAEIRQVPSQSAELSQAPTRRSAMLRAALHSHPTGSSTMGPTHKSS